MKNFSTLCLAILLSINWSSAQNTESLERTMSLGKQPAVYVEIEGADEDLAVDIWKDYVKDYGKTKRNKKAKEYYTEDVRIPLLTSSGNVSLYAQFEEGRDLTTVYLWVEHDGYFLSDTEKVEAFLQDYYTITRREVIMKEVEEQEKLLKNLGKDLEKLEKKNKGYHKDIEKAEEKIRKAEENIEKNLNDQDQLNNEIENQKAILEEIIERLNAVGKN